tara:strand:- start:83 stop:289 length:207 start_codon:yes stop_codon:yes gene_type:complete
VYDSVDSRIGRSRTVDSWFRSIEPPVNKTRLYFFLKVHSCVSFVFASTLLLALLLDHFSILQLTPPLW